ncbi:MotA/TolQ/ExbB proton channel family protein [Novosphingobium lentum]|uniref:MotA/TolQ/ExbB proton channel family protein n=1 Tax=Novosphingobium lentum TaxID=145287 RepID=UPI0008353508|nr:MotA/TolQ/ExbB proton channel family protein [Novosphingobium lentum]
MNPFALLDAQSAAIVVGGTLLATVLRCGVSDVAASVRAVAGLGRRRFRSEQARADLSSQVREICADGLLRAHPRPIGDREFDDATGALIEQRSLKGLLDRHEAHKAGRLAVAEVAARTLAQAAELAPVFGLAGTLTALSQLPANGLDHGALNGAISMAVITTLYGLLLANFVFAPLSRMVERREEAEERERQDVIDWLAWQVSPVCREPSSAHPAQRFAA